MMLRDAGFDENAKRIHLTHRAQTKADVAALNLKYSQPVMGAIRVSEAVLLLDTVTDPTDKDLYKITQWGHVCQVLAMMEAEKVTSEEMLVSALVHDIGKILLAIGEDPANVVCDNLPIGDYPEGIGLDQVVFTWNHDEFGYNRLRDHLPWHMAKLVRYHSIHPSALKYLSAEDRWLYQGYLEPFRRYDKRSKSTDTVPEIDRAKYLAMLDRWFPDPVIL